MAKLILDTGAPNLGRHHRAALRHALFALEEQGKQLIGPGSDPADKARRDEARALHNKIVTNAKEALWLLDHGAAYDKRK